MHRATLPNGKRVAVKVQRPGAPRQIEADLALLYQAAKIAKERIRALDFIDARSLVDEFARSIRQELDYRSEARNADRFRHNWAGDPHVRIPHVYWSYTRARVLTLELLEGIQLADVEAESYTLEERRRLAYRMTETWMTMIFRHGFFHADPHPANILVLPGDRIGLVDFGQVGKLTDDDIDKATRLFIDVASENLENLPKRFADLGVRYPKEKEEEFRVRLRELYYKYYGATLAEIDPIQIIREAFQLIYSMNLQLPTRFVLLDKTIATLGSVGIELYEDFNVFEVAQPYARSLVRDRLKPHALARQGRRELARLAYIASEFPYQLHDILEEVRDGQIEVGFVHKGMDEFMLRLNAALNRLVVALVVVGGLIGSSLIGIFADHGPMILGVNVLSVIGFVLSGVLGALAPLGSDPQREALGDELERAAVERRVEGVANAAAEIVRGERLLDVRHSRLQQLVLLHQVAGVAGHEENGQVEPLRELRAAELRHHDVGEQEVDRLLACDLDRLGAAVGEQHAIAAPRSTVAT